MKPDPENIIDVMRLALLSDANGFPMAIPPRTIMEAAASLDTVNPAHREALQAIVEASEAIQRLERAAQSAELRLSRAARALMELEGKHNVTLPTLTKETPKRRLACGRG